MISLRFIACIACIVFAKISYGQVLVFFKNDNSVFIEDLNSSKKNLLSNNELTIDSVLRRKYNTRPPVVLLNETDTLVTKVYLFDKRKLIVKYCGMALFLGENFLRESGSIDCILNNHDYAPRGNARVDFMPLFSNDFMSLVYKNDSGPMFIDRSAIMELNLVTGRIVLIKKKCKNPIYSPDGRFILLQDLNKKERYYVYDKSLKKIIKKYSNLREVYWLEG